MIKVSKKERDSFLKSRKAQQAVEYLTLFGIVAVIIAVTFIIFGKYSSSTKDDIVLENTEGTLKILVKEAERVYFIGKESKNVVRVNIPAYVKKITTKCDLTTGVCPNGITVVVELSTGESELTVTSQAPINVADNVNSDVRGTKKILIYYKDVDPNPNKVLYAVDLSQI